MRKIQLAIMAVALAGAMSASAVLVTEQSVSPNVIVSINVSGPTPYSWSGGVYAGIYNLLVDGQAVPSLCVDVWHFSPPANTVYTYKPLDQVPPKTGGPMGTTAATTVEELWASYFAGAKGSDTEAAALQLAVWKTVAGDELTYTASDAITTRVNAMLASPGTHPADLIGLANDTWQSYAVPEPTTMIAGALLLLPFGASTMRALRKNRAA
jgi:hypothetical protein